MKKLFGILVGMLAAVILLPGAVSAAGNEAKIVDTEYPTLAAAVEAAGENDTITLLTDVVSGTIIINKPLIINLGGHNLSSNGAYILDIYSDLTLQNGSVSVTGLGKQDPGTGLWAGGSGIWINGDGSLKVTSDVTMSVTDSVEDTNSGMITFYSDCDGAKLDFDGTITGEMGISVNGNIVGEKSVIVNIGNNAKIDVEETALYLAGNSATTIGAAQITGGTGIEIRAGSLTVDGAAITATMPFEEVPNSGGTTISGAAVAVSQHTTNQPISVTINSGSFTGAKAIYETDLQDATGSDDVAIDVAGGNYNGEVASVNHTEFVSGGIFSQPIEAAYVVPASTVANRTSGDTTTYFIGTPTTVAAYLADTKAGDAIEVTQGNLELAALPGDVTVKNTGEGTVTANGETATAEGVTTVAPTEPETDPISPPTGDAFNPVVWAIVTGLAAILFGTTLYQSRKQRR